MGLWQSARLIQLRGSTVTHYDSKTSEFQTSGCFWKHLKNNQCVTHCRAAAAELTWSKDPPEHPPGAAPERYATAMPEHYDARALRYCDAVSCKQSHKRIGTNFWTGHGFNLTVTSKLPLSVLLSRPHLLPPPPLLCSQDIRSTWSIDRKWETSTAKFGLTDSLLQWTPLDPVSIQHFHSDRKPFPMSI